MARAFYFGKRAMCVLLTTLCLNGQQLQPIQSTQTLADIFQGVAEGILAPCQSWPPKLATDPKKQDEKPNGKSLVTATTELTKQFFAPLKVASSVKPYVYKASFLRMFDRPSDFEPTLSDDHLLGIAIGVSPDTLSLWGTDLYTVKYDCISMLGLVAQSGANVSIPFFSLDGAFKATLNRSAGLSATFIFGSFQSPFDLFYYGGDPSRKTFAALKALEWRLNNKKTAAVEYLSAAQLLSISKNYDAASSQGLLGNVKAGITLPIAHASGSLDGNFSHSLQVKGQGFDTYFWEPLSKKTLPTLTDLAFWAASNLPQLETQDNQLVYQATKSATATLPGWPKELCTPGEWQLKSNNNHFSPTGLSMTVAPSAGQLPNCSIAADFSLISPNPAPSDVANPRLLLQSARDSSVVIPLQLRGTLSPPGTPLVSVEFVPAKWDVSTDPAGKKDYVYWVVKGRVDVPAGRQFSAAKLRVADFSCKSQDNTALRLDAIDFQGSPTPLMLTGGTGSFALNVKRSLLGIPPLNDDYAQSDKKTCAVTGKLEITTTNLAGMAPAKDEIPLQTGLVYYPNDLVAPGVPKVTVASIGNGTISLSWTAATGAARYRIYRGTSAGAESSTGAETASMNFTDNGLANGVPYFYQVTGVNSIGEGMRSVEVSATPLAPPTAPIVSIAVGNGQLSLSWPAIPGVLGYKVYRSQSSGTEVELKTGLTSASYSDTGLVNDSTYFYQVSAVNSAGEGAKSNEVNGKPHN